MYASSLVEDPDNDRDRKLKFSSHFGHIVLSHSNQSHLLILGDFNAGLDAKIDPVQNHIGPQVIGARASINDDDRDNAILLFELLQSHNLTLPQTWKLVSYKETTCSDHLLNGEDAKDWAALDDLLCPISLRNTLSFQGSVFQQAINSRHLPLSFHLRTRYLPIAKQIQPPKTDYRSMAQFFTALEKSFLTATENSFTAPTTSSHNIIAYTDGSCPNNRAVSYDNPAGWGFALVYDHPIDSHPPASALGNAHSDLSDLTLNRWRVSQ